jgi:hypothetical protein
MNSLRPALQASLHALRGTRLFRGEAAFGLRQFLCRFARLTPFARRVSKAVEEPTAVQKPSATKLPPASLIAIGLQFDNVPFQGPNHRVILRTHRLGNSSAPAGRFVPAAAWSLLAALLLALGAGLSHHHEARAEAPGSACQGHTHAGPAGDDPAHSHSGCAACAFLAQFLTEPDALLATFVASPCPVGEALAATGFSRISDGDRGVWQVRGPPAAA